METEWRNLEEGKYRPSRRITRQLEMPPLHAFVSVVRENGTAVEMNGNRRAGDETPSRLSTAETRVINSRNADSEILSKEQNNEYGNQSQKKTRAREEKSSQIESWTPKATRATKPEVDRAAPEVASSIGHRLTRTGEKLTVRLETARLADGATEKTTPTEERQRQQERRQEQKAAKTISLILLAFVVTWTPYNILTVVRAFSHADAIDP